MRYNWQGMLTTAIKQEQNMSNKKMIWESVDPLLTGVVELLMEDAEEAELLNDYFGSAFIRTTLPQNLWTNKMYKNRQKGLQIISARYATELLTNWNEFKFAGLNEIHCRVPKEKAKKILAPLTTIFAKSWIIMSSYKTGEGLL